MMVSCQRHERPAAQFGALLGAGIAAGFAAGEFNTESYRSREENAFHAATQKPRSTFSIDVDTASYANVRRFVREGERVPRGAVRTEEFVNSFRYDYPAPGGSDPFSISTEVAACPWNPAHHLARIGLRGREIAAAERPAANLVVLADVSGSMQSADKLPLMKRALRVLVEQLKGDDRIALAVYAGASGLALPSTPGFQKSAILAALGGFEAGGSTNAGEGIRLAYREAREGFINGGINRVILCTDGDFNVGVTSESELVDLVRKEAGGGIYLTVLGFGMGNLKDSTLETLADKGDGQYAYVDDDAEARRVLGEQAGATLQVIAKDVKIQVEFNPATVRAWRLIGYENRLLADEDFNDDTKDAGEIGAGHRVTALYEIIPVGAPHDDRAERGVDPLKYQTVSARGDSPAEMMTVKVRSKSPEGGPSTLAEAVVRDQHNTFENATDDFRFAAAVAAFGQWLSGSEMIGKTSRDQILSWARPAAVGPDQTARQEFLDIVSRVRRSTGE